MQKDFDIWNRLKKKLQGNKSEAYFHEREIWWCSIGVNLGFEQKMVGATHLSAPYL